MHVSIQQRTASLPIHVELIPEFLNDPGATRLSQQIKRSNWKFRPTLCVFITIDA